MSRWAGWQDIIITNISQFPSNSTRKLIWCMATVLMSNNPKVKACSTKNGKNNNNSHHTEFREQFQFQYQCRMFRMRLKPICHSMMIITIIIYSRWNMKKFVFTNKYFVFRLVFEILRTFNITNNDTVNVMCHEHIGASHRNEMNRSEWHVIYLRNGCRCRCEGADIYLNMQICV